VQAAALVPAAQRPFVPYKARAFCTQQQRQQVAGKLFGLQLVLLLQELRVPPQQQEQVSTAAAAAAAAAAALSKLVCAAAAASSDGAAVLAVAGIQTKSCRACATAKNVVQHDSVLCLLPVSTSIPTALLYSTLVEFTRAVVSDDRHKLRSQHAFGAATARSFGICSASSICRSYTLQVV
jgi:hypothetical protein